MVEELDLTDDQDISTIAKMIDAEIHSHIPDWIPSGLNGDYSTMQRCLSSPDSLRLDRFPSGRKVWSSPKAGDSRSPFAQRSSSKLSSPSKGRIDDKEVGVVVEKLESLLRKQREEIEEMHRDQERVVCEFLKEFSPEICEEALLRLQAMDADSLLC